MDPILEKLEKQSRQQLRFTKILCILCVLMLACALVLTMSVTNAAKQIVTLVEPLQTVANQASAVIGNLDTVALTLAEADLGAMVENVNTLTASSQQAVTEALEKLEGIDIDTLNTAIEDLAIIVEPLAKVSKLFG